MKATITLTISELSSILKRAMESEKYFQNHITDFEEDLNENVRREARCKNIAENIFLGE